VTTIKFVMQKETPGTVRYQEVTEEGEQVAIGTLYVRKKAAEKLTKAVGYPNEITVTITEG
jgi:hypothetical protein